MSANEETLLAKQAIENGAFLCIQKPINIELVKHLWQHVTRERCRKNKEKNTIGEINKVVEVENGGGENDGNKNVTGKRKVKSGKAPMDDQINEGGVDGSSGKIKRKVSTEWTRELHVKFMDAVHQLGEGRCYPKEILERMNVPGLTRMQVASHLQKCRRDNWRPPEERKYQPRTSPETPDNDHSQETDSTRRFGSMPRSRKGSQPEKMENSETPQINLASSNNNNFKNERGNSSRQVEVSQNTGQQGTMDMLNEETSHFVYPIDTSHVPTGIPATTNAIDMPSHDIFGPNLVAFGSNCATLMTSYVNWPNRRQPSEDFLELTDEMDFLVNDPPEFEQGSGSNDGQSH